MKNLYIILAVLGIILVVALGLFIWQFKTVDWSGFGSWFNNVSINLKQNSNFTDTSDANTNETEDGNLANTDALQDGEAVEAVGELNFYTLELGRSAADILSKCTYTFYLPVDFVYELQGVDASSSILLFKKDDQEIFKMTNFDYARSEDDIDNFWPDAAEYSLEGGHTNIVELLDDDYEDEMYIFVDTLKIDDQPVF